MYEVLDKDTIKSEILPHLSVAKRGYVSKKLPGGSYSIHSLQVENRLPMAHASCFHLASQGWCCIIKLCMGISVNGREMVNGRKVKMTSFFKHVRQPDIAPPPKNLSIIVRLCYTQIIR